MILQLREILSRKLTPKYEWIQKTMEARYLAAEMYEENVRLQKKIEELEKQNYDYKKVIGYKLYGREPYNY